MLFAYCLSWFSHHSYEAGTMVLILQMRNRGSEMLCIFPMEMEWVGGRARKGNPESVSRTSPYNLYAAHPPRWLTNYKHYLWLSTEKAMAPHSSTLAWKIPRTEEPGRLQSMGSLRVRHDWVTSLSLFTFHFHALEKEMATHSSVLAWRIPGTGEPGGLLSLGSHRVRHDWSDLAAAAAWLSRGFSGDSDSKKSAFTAGDLGLIPGSGIFRGEGNGYHSSILAWEIPWTEEASGL